jgi:hypothetical protein
VAEVILKDYEFRCRNPCRPGTVTFNVTNAGSHDHNLSIDVGGTKKKMDADLKPAPPASLSCAHASTYDIDCPNRRARVRWGCGKLAVLGNQ